MNKLLWLSLFLLSISFKDAECCSCYSTHPQDVMCSKNVDFVMKAVILSGKHLYKQNLSDADKHIFGLAYYNAYVTKIFKGADVLKDVLSTKNKTENVNFRRQKAIVYTSITSGTCGVNLKLGTKYLLSGIIVNGKIKIGTCDWIVPFEDLSRQQRAGIRGGYDCQCRIKRCPYGILCERPREACDWNGKGVVKEVRCDMKHKTCRKIGNRCLWVEDLKYETCVLKYILKYLPKMT